MLALVAHHTLIFASASVTASLGGLLLGISIPPDTKWKNLYISRAYLALACFILSGFNFLIFFSRTYAYSSSIQNMLIVTIASYQALLFTMTLLTFIQPLYVRKERVIPQFAIIVAVTLLLFLTMFFWKTAFPFVFYAAVAGYLFQLTYYTTLFRKKYTLCLRQLEEYYDEDEDHRLQWVRSGFYTALSIGVMALCALFNEWLCDAFIVIYTLFYIYMISHFLNYRINEMKFVLPAVTRESGRAEKEKPQGWKTLKPRQMTNREQKFKVALEKWIEQRKFFEKDVGVEEIARSLGANSSFLRYYFRTHMQNDFRTWRSELRIREAQRIMDKNPKLSISRICEEVGFNDKGNFHRQFQKITGTTPANYRQSCCERINIERKDPVARRT
ncbi:MAG TPA: AraC family transcriptional regulator [Proteiniphilum sp.]|nr:AraC family transcriptional regulator [Proteiniphilum sp.]HPJ49974.1 AraC family transcriptional regulator [Proteiniphilum sp.]HPR20812.1 AraC family transcriptional regulator [Proteiniphilum sp.]